MKIFRNARWKFKFDEFSQHLASGPKISLPDIRCVRRKPKEEEPALGCVASVRWSDVSFCGHVRGHTANGRCTCKSMRYYVQSNKHQTNRNDSPEKEAISELLIKSPKTRKKQYQKLSRVSGACNRTTIGFLIRLIKTIRFEYDIII